MVRLSRFAAVHYRGIDGLELDLLPKANLITGINGVGKTALIEAIWLFTGRHNIPLLWNPNLQRSALSEADPISRLSDNELHLWGVENGERHDVRYVFERLTSGPRGMKGREYHSKETETLGPVVGEIKAYFDGSASEERKVIQITNSGVVLVHAPLVPQERAGCVIETAKSHYAISDEHFQRYSDLVKQGKKKELLTAIRLVSKDIEDIDMLADSSGESYLWVALEKSRSRTIDDLGGGVLRLVRLLLGFSAAKGGMLLADELENGIHYSLHHELWERTKDWISQWNVQFVATTHSAELIDAAMDVFSDNPEDLAIHKLFQNEETGCVGAATFTGEALIGAREMDLEVR